MKIILTDDHRYVDEETGNEYPGVTSIIKSAGLMGYMPDDPWYMERGSAVHSSTELYDKGTLDDSSVDPRISGYLLAWKRYRDDSQFVPEFIEKIFYHPVYCYCGTPDRNGLDIKTGSPAPWHILQGAAYKNLSDSPVWKTIYLQEDSGYKVVTYNYFELREAFKIFTSALAIHNWKKLRGIK